MQEGEGVNRVGERFGRLLVLTWPKGNRCACLCDCGRETTVWKTSLPTGNTRSCGCLRDEFAGTYAKPKHGGWGTRTYKSWNSAITRCSWAGDPSYPKYGALGVKVCDRWKDYANFLADMGERPVGKTLDRYPNPSGDYEPSNCRWATPTEQSRNRRNSVLIELSGVTRHINEWSELYGVPHQTVRSRLRKGWAAEAALATPVQRRST